MRRLTAVMHSASSPQPQVRYSRKLSFIKAWTPFRCRSSSGLLCDRACGCADTPLLSTHSVFSFRVRPPLMSVEVIRDLTILELPLSIFGCLFALCALGMDFVLMLIRPDQKSHFIKHQIWHCFHGQYTLCFDDGAILERFTTLAPTSKLSRSPPVLEEASIVLWFELRKMLVLYLQ